MRRTIHPLCKAFAPCGIMWMIMANGACIASNPAERPVPIEPGVAQLFIDDYLIESQSNLERTLHRPAKDHGGNVPVIAARPETSLLAYGSIVRDTRLGCYVMFVQEFPSRDMYRCTSVDGLVWEKKGDSVLEPVTFQIDVEPEEGSRAGIDLFSCYYDEKDAKHPYKGWLYLANYGNDREGIYYIQSADGVTWQTGRQIFSAYADPEDTSCTRIHQDGKTVYGPGDVTIMYRDEKEDRFLGVFKFFTTTAVPPGNNLRSRAYAFLDRIDEPFDTHRIKKVELLPPAAAVDGNRPYDEFYASTAWRYESLWLGGLKVWHSKEDYPYSAAGCAFLKLLVSRDGLNWSKVQFENKDGVPEVFIPNGPEGGNDGQNDGGYISEFSQGPLRIGDELIYYYSASSLGKNAPKGTRITGGGIFRARLPADGFVSVDGGTLTTRPLGFHGNDLTLYGSGQVAVAVLDASEKLMAETEVTCNSRRSPVVFEGKSLGQVVPGGIARLRLTIHPSGRLYSFTIR